MGNKKVFVDSSVLVAACLSSSGASYFCIISTPEAGYKLLINEMVFEETLDVLKRKFPELRNRFFGLLSIGNFSILENPEKKELKIVKNLIEEKDAPILISAVKHADYLLTLDKGFFKKEVINFAKGHKLIILPPKEFIRFLKQNFHPHQT
jgi:predicted nucleic acid-binding protein